MQNNSAVSDEQIIAALIEHGTIKEAATSISITPRTVYDRMKEKQFMADYMQAKNEILRLAVYNINARLSEAIDTVAEIMNNPANKATVRLQAAQTIINNANKFMQRLAADEKSSADAAKSMFDVE